MEPLAWLRKQLETADVDLLREMVSTFIAALMGAEADAICGAPYGERSPERVNQRNGYRERDFDTRAGTIALEVPKLRTGSYFPGWLLERRRRAERALVAVIAECYVRGVSTRRVDGLVKTLGIEGISRSQVSEPQNHGHPHLRTIEAGYFGSGAILLYGVEGGGVPRAQGAELAITTGGDLDLMILPVFRRHPALVDLVNSGNRRGAHCPRLEQRRYDQRHGEHRPGSLDEGHDQRQADDQTRNHAGPDVLHQQCDVRGGCRAN